MYLNETIDSMALTSTSVLFYKCYKIYLLIFENQAPIEMLPIKSINSILINILRIFTFDLVNAQKVINIIFIY